MSKVVVIGFICEYEVYCRRHGLDKRSTARVCFDHQLPGLGPCAIKLMPSWRELPHAIRIGRELEVLRATYGGHELTIEQVEEL